MDYHTVNLLELRVVRLVCKFFLPLISLLHVQIMLDNVIMVMYINKQ